MHRLINEAKVRPALFGLGLSYMPNLAYLLIFVEADFTTHTETGNLFSYYAPLLVFLVTTMTAALLVFIVSWCGKRIKDGALLFACFLAIVVTAVICIAQLGSVNHGFMLLASFFLGLTNSLSLILWGRVYGALSSRESLFYSSTSCASVGVLCAVPAVLSQVVLRLFFVLACAALGICFLWYEIRQVNQVMPAGLAHSATSWKPLQGAKRSQKERLQFAKVSQVPQGVTSHALTSDVVSFLWKPVVGLFLCTYVMGVKQGLDRMNAFESTGVRLICSALMIAVVIIVLLDKRDELDTMLLFQVALPIAATILMFSSALVSGFGTYASGAAFVAFVVWNICIAVFDMFSWTAFAVSVRYFNATDDIVFSARAILCPGGVLFGVFFALLLDEATLQIIFLLLSTIYVIAFVLSLSLKSRAANDHVGNTEVSDAVNSDSGDTCAQLAREFALSEREAEVLQYLAKGRSGPYIAEKLFLSPYTVKTYVHRIYDKLGVTSRQEVIDLFDAKGE